MYRHQLISTVPKKYQTTMCKKEISRGFSEKCSKSIIWKLKTCYIHARKNLAVILMETIKKMDVNCITHVSLFPLTSFLPSLILFHSLEKPYMQTIHSNNIN
ncbi:hypothetical protein AAHE18_07G160400 [Arachis hypogaea]